MLGDVIGSLTRPIRLRADRQSLHNRLERLRDTFKTYLDAGLPAGHEFYVNLYTRAKKATAEHAERWDLDLAALEMEIPVLYEMQCKAEGTPVRRASWFLGVLGTFGLAVGLGLFPAVIASVYDYVRGMLS